MSLFPTEQVLILASEDLRHRHRAVLDRIAAFLGIDPFPPLDLVLAHRTPPVPPLALPTRADHNHLHELYAADLALFATLSSIDTTEWAASRPAQD